MAITDGLVFRAQPQAGDTTIHNNLPNAETLSGTATVTLVDDVGEAWEVSGGTLATSLVNSFTVSNGSEATIAFRLKETVAPSGGNNFDTVIASGGVKMSYEYNNYNKRFKIGNKGPTPIWVSPADTYYTVVMKVFMTDAVAADQLSVWLSTNTSRADNSADLLGVAGNYTNPVMDAVFVGTQSGSVLRLKDFMVWNRGLTDAECVAVADDIRSQLPFSASDIVPDAFTFTDQTGLPAETLVESDTITVTGIQAASPLIITGGEFSVNGGAYTSTGVDVNDGDTVQLRTTTSSSLNTAADVTLTIGGVSDTWSATTQAAASTLTLPEMKNNTGTVIASDTDIQVDLYHNTTGAHLLRKTGLASDASGIVSVTDNKIASGVTYLVVVKRSGGGYGMAEVLVP